MKLKRSIPTTDKRYSLLIIKSRNYSSAIYLAKVSGSSMHILTYQGPGVEARTFFKILSLKGNN